MEAPRPLQPVPEPESDEEDALQRAVRRYRRDLVQSEAGAKLGDDPAAVHRQRVATRRLRSLFRSAGPLSSDPDRSQRLSEELRWVGRALGEVRDLDVLITYLLDELTRLEEASAFGAVLELLDGERQEARRELAAMLGSERYRKLIDELAQPPRLGPAEDLASAAIGEHERLRESVERLGDDPLDVELHKVRIQVKRARYAAEVAGAGPRYVERAKRLQEILGDHQDASIAEQRIRELLVRVGGMGRTALAAGRLIERQRRRRGDARRIWRKAWKRLDRAGAAEWR